MIFHEFGDKSKPLAILIHGCFQPWQTLLPIAKSFEKDYFVIMPALNGHTAEKVSRFESIENEAEQIEEYILKNYGKEIFALCGFSMGGAVAYEILKLNRIQVKNAILDGAPLVSTGKFLSNIMESNYVKIAEKSKVRDKKTLENFGKNFLPEKYLGDFLSFIDKTEEESVRNMLRSVSEARFDENLKLNNTKLLYLHGTKANEALAKKSAKLIEKFYSDATVVSFKGDGHIECAIHEPDDWAKVAKDFFING